MKNLNLKISRKTAFNFQAPVNKSGNSIKSTTTGLTITTNPTASFTCKVG
jgi:hypothetical protein